MEFLLEILIWLLFPIAYVVALTLISKRSKTKAAKLPLPPGPTPSPFIGNLLQLGDKPHKSLTELAKIHGSLMSLRLGEITTVVISSATLAKQILQTHDLTFANRTWAEAVKVHDHHLVSVAWLPVGASWRNLRKICNSYLFSIQKLDSNQDIRRKKIRELLDDVQESCRVGAAVNVGQLAFKAALNVLSSNVFSLDLSDSESDLVREFKYVVMSVMEEAARPNVADYFPLLRRFDPQRIKHRNRVYMGKLLDLFDRIIDKRLQLREENGYSSTIDVLDTLLTLAEDKRMDMDRKSMKHLIMDLFAAGTDTTSSTLEWAMTNLLRKREVLSKARAEIEQAIGTRSMLQESDIAELPYLKAIIKETFRLYPAIPFLLPRKAGSDVEMDGFIIPKDAQVMVNAWAIGRDPSLWEYPEIFRPERFLGSDIDVRGRNFELIPFGGGRRICPGMPLAMRMLHMMLGSLIHSFDWKLEDGVTAETLDMEDRFGLTLQKAQPLLAIPIQL